MDMPAAIQDALDLVSNLCHGREEAVFCLRCTGVWAGAALALPVLFLGNRRTTLWICLFLVFAIIQMPVVGYSEMELPDPLKCLSGQLFSLSAVYLLAINTVRRLFRKRSDKSAGSVFLLITAVGIGALQALILLESEKAYQILDHLCLAGLAACVLLSVWMLLAFLFAFRRKRRGGNEGRRSVGAGREEAATAPEEKKRQQRRMRRGGNSAG